MNNISFVYFDLGGVVDLDFSGTNKWNEMKKALGVTKTNEAQYEAVWQRYAHEICLNRDVDTLIPILEKEAGLTFEEGHSLLLDFVNRFEKNPSVWPIITETKQKYRIGLLTNMYPRMFPLIKAKGIIPPVEWDAIVDSSVVGCQKPDEEIFKIAEEKANAKGDQILFIDNSPQHIEAAKKMKWNTFFYDSSNPEKSSEKFSIYLRGL